MPMSRRTALAEVEAVDPSQSDAAGVLIRHQAGRQPNRTIAQVLADPFGDERLPQVAVTSFRRPARRQAPLATAE
jgi:hypothetical protein